MSFNKYFDKLYCINLDKRPDRWLEAKNEFNKFKIENVERFSGVDGNELKQNLKILNGEAGILLTHINLIKKCLDDKVSNVLIFEDDVIFTNEINYLDDYMNKLPKDWDMIYFGGNHIYGPKPIKINDKILKIDSTVALHCVGIKNTVFEQILQLLPKMAKQVDAYYTIIQKSFNAYCVTPNIAIQRRGFSDIQNKIVDYRNFFINE
jgi:GR25 family glycosyltransferase involved in LPS biosynthesis